MIRALVPALCLVALVSCAAGSSTPTNAALPSRPQELSVLGLDACGLLPQSVAAELRLEPRGRVVEPPPKAPPDARVCGWSRSVLEHPSASAGVGLLPQNVADYLGQPGVEQTSVAGFSAVQLPNELAAEKQSCDLLIDVADRQALLVSYYNTLGDEPGATHELMCERAHRAAEGVMQQLLATRK